MKIRSVQYFLLAFLQLLSAACWAEAQEAEEPTFECAPSSTNENGECSNNPEQQLVDYLIVGGGGSGIQTAIFLQNHGYSYQILEREQTAGSFWTQYPVFQELISVNKKVRNETQKMRYDWHSFLDTPISMWDDVSKDYFPSGNDWHRYMNMVVTENNLNIEYGTQVERLAMDGTPCVYLIDGTKRCAKYRVFVGTGLKEKDEPYLQAIGGIPYSKMTKEIAVGKKVCILGNGNAGYEVAQNVFGVAESVVISGKHPTRLSSVTKYTGDVRAKFLTPLENFHGKLLDTIVHQDIPFQWAKDRLGYLHRNQAEEITKVMSATATAKYHHCEVLVLATGFQSQVPGMQLTKRRFPLTTDWYAAKDNPTINYIGWLMHQRDFQKGAGGFLSGYRYLIRNLIHHVREEDHGIEYPYHEFSNQEVLNHAVNRFQIASDLIILQDGVVCRDAIVPIKRKESDKKKYRYYEGVTYNFHKDFDNRDDIIYLYFAWGDDRTAASVFDNVYMYNDTLKLRNVFLHPVVEVNGMVREAEEDLNMVWNTVQFIPPIKRIVRDAIRGNFTKFYPKPYFPYQRMEMNQPTEKPIFEQGQNPGMNVGELIELTTEAVLRGGTNVTLKGIRHEARKIIPSLIFPPQKMQIDAANNETADESPRFEACVLPGNSCGIQDSSLSSCCDGASCVFVSDLDTSFCVNRQ